VIALAWVLCLASTALCVVYGALNWNKGNDAVDDGEVREWAAEEEKLDEEL
jgi:hypothetical protein